MMIDYAKTLEALRLLFDVNNFGVYKGYESDLVLSADKTCSTGNRRCAILNLHYVAFNKFKPAVWLTKSNSSVYVVSTKFFEMLPHKKFISFDDEVFHKFPTDRETVIRFTVDNLLEMLKPGGDGIYVGVFTYGPPGEKWYKY